MIKDSFVPLDQQQIKSYLIDPEINIEVLESTSSTNEHLKNLNHPSLQVCVAETQLAGKGRLGKTWHSPFGHNIYFSLSYPVSKTLTELSGLSLIVALATCKAIEVCTKSDRLLSVKWPNDLLIDGKKVSGNLIEIQHTLDGRSYLIIGIGINVNMLQAQTEEITQEWTSLRDITGQYHDRNPVCAALINQLLAYLHKFEQHGFSSFKNEWQTRDYFLGKQILLDVNQTVINGVCEGVNAQGHIVIKLPNAIQQNFTAGEARLIKKAKA